MLALLWIIAAFLFGALPFSVWIGRLALQQDVRALGDGNPGATNVFRAGGYGWGALAALLDFLKGAVPVAAAYFGAGLSGWLMALTALAPPFGHAFSPFLRFRGGKALAASIGIWAGLTVGEGPMILGLFLGLWELLLDVDGWAVILGMVGLLAHLLLNHPDPLLLRIWALNALLLAWTHRTDLAQTPRLRGWWRYR